MKIKENINQYITENKNFYFTLVAVSKNHPAEAIKEAYETGQRDFGENKVQELTEKQAMLPKDIKWHLVGHLQRNKVKYIAPFIHLIHSVDSLDLLKEINKEAKKNKRVINCLLQVYIAKEESKFGLEEQEAENLLNNPELNNLQHINITGLMGIATNTEDKDTIRQEFSLLKGLFEKWKNKYARENVSFTELSLGMSSDYKIALEEGSTMIRIGTAIFGNRNY